MLLRRALLPAVLTLVLGMAATASAATVRPDRLPARIKGAMGLVPHFGVQDPAAGASTPVVYHGGSVMRPSVTLHAIFWAPPGFQFHAGYKALIDQFLTDVATDSGTNSNVFSVLPEFADLSGPGAYAITKGADINDAQPFPASDQCASATGLPTCLTDHQVQAEAQRVADAGPLPVGLGDMYLVFLPQDVDTCIVPGACATSAFGGYHSLSGDTRGTLIYANLPDPEVAGTLPDTDTFPQGNSDAAIMIDTAAHEIVEAMTDPTGVGWMDPNGFEVADKCEFGPAIGPVLGQAANGADFNQLINGHEYLIQEMWSNNLNTNGACVQRSSDPTTHIPQARVALTQFSSTVSGNTGAPNVGVTVDLVRSGEAVSEATTTSDGAGAWHVTLSHAVGDDRDEIDVNYSGAGAPPDDTIVTGNGGDPFGEAGWTGWGDLDTQTFIPDNNTVVVFPCFQTGVFQLTVGGTLTPMGTCDTETDATVTDVPAGIDDQAVTLSSDDNRGFALASPFGRPDNPFGTLVDMTVGLGEPGGGFPLCTADLEHRSVSCSGLVPDSTYSLVRARGALTRTADSDDDGNAAATFPSLVGGDAVALRDDARTLTTIHVAHLRVDLTGNRTTVSGGRCEPGDYYGTFVPGPTQSDSAGGGGGPAGTGTVCDGDPAGLPADDIAQTDDFSGGLTRTEVPAVQDTSPMQGETVYGAFTALAEAGFAQPDNSVVPSGDRVNLTVLRAGHAVLSVANVNTGAGVALPALAPGSYSAVWEVIGANGDTRTVTTRFIAHSALTGPQGPRGPRGKRGKRGRPGRDARVTCRVVGKTIRCKVMFAKAKKARASVRAVLSRGGRILALGHGRLRAGRATLRMTPVRRTVRGRARVTIVVRTGRRSAVTVQMAVRIR